MPGNFPDDLRYSESDEWVRVIGDQATVGVTEYASEQLGDVVYVQLPEVGTQVSKGSSFGEVESVKAVSELNCPLTGEVLSANMELDQNPGLVNEDPYGAGWMIQLRVSDASELGNLLDAEAYRQNTLERQ